MTNTKLSVEIANRLTVMPREISKSEASDWLLRVADLEKRLQQAELERDAANERADKALDEAASERISFPDGYDSAQGFVDALMAENTQYHHDLTAANARIAKLERERQERAAWRAVAEHCANTGRLLQVWENYRVRVVGVGLSPCAPGWQDSIINLADALGLKWRK